MYIRTMIPGMSERFETEKAERHDLGIEKQIGDRWKWKICPERGDCRFCIQDLNTLGGVAITAHSDMNCSMRGVYLLNLIHDTVDSMNL